MRFSRFVAARSLGGAVTLVGLLAVVGASRHAVAQNAFSAYGLQGFSLRSVPPIASGSFDIRGDYLPDGRVVAVTGLSVYIESAPASGLFHEGGRLDAASVGGGSDPAFLRVSPDGSMIAIGAGFGRSVAVFPTSVLAQSGGGQGTPLVPVTAGGATRYFSVPHYEAAWADASHLALTAGGASTSFVSLLDIASSPDAPVNPTIISNIGGASAGIGFDQQGRLFTGNGFDFDDSSGSVTGTIRAFEATDWAAAPADFESAGIFIGEVLSAGSLVFDREGNLVVGGGDFGSEFDAGYLGVINADAIARVLAGDPLGFDPASPADLRRLDPLAAGTGFFGAAFNPLTRELAVTSGSSWFVTVPSPAAMVLCGFLFGARRNRADRSV